MIIAAQSSYTGVDLGIYNGSQLLISAYISKKDACALLIPTLDTLMKNNKILCTDIEYIVVNRGPGPFTSLRTVIATMNGIAFTTNIPLIGVNTLEIMMHEYDPYNEKTVLILLNAYGKEYYYGFKISDTPLQMGVCTNAQLPVYTGQDPVYIIGQIEMLTEKPVQYAQTVLVPNYAYSTLNGVAVYAQGIGLNQKTATNHLSPLYFKNHF